MREIYRGETLVVRAGYDDAGRLAIDGEDRGGHPMFEEYEYFIRIEREYFAAVRAALNGAVGTDLVGLLEGRASELVRRGETAWLKAHGIPYDFHTWTR